MSMRDYPVTQDAAFNIDHEAAAFISLSLDKKKGCVPEAIAKLSWNEFVERARDWSLPEDYGDIQISELLSEMCIVSFFDGDVTTLFPDKAKHSIDEGYNEADVYYIPASKDADLFSAAYASPDELLNEFKELFSKKEIRFPDDFDWWGHLVKIVGTTYG